MANFLTNEQRQELFHELKREDKAKYSDRIKVILLLDKGWTYAKISEALFLDEGTIANYRKRYKDGGIEELVNDNYSGRRSKLSNKKLIELQIFLTGTTFQKTQEICDYVKNKYQVDYSLSGMITLLHLMGFSYKKAKGIPGKANKEAQEQFVADYEKLKSANGKIYFADSTHPQHNPVLSYGWIKTGEEVEIKTNSGRRHLNITGAVEIGSKEVITRNTDRVNENSICELMRAIKAKNSQEKNITLILDNAAFNKSHKVKGLAKELGIKLFYLPPYSPNLNPIERLWKFAKKKVQYNQYYEKFIDFKLAFTLFFRGIRQYHDELTTLITDNFKVLGD
jgi:transposase